MTWPLTEQGFLVTVKYGRTIRNALRVCTRLGWVLELAKKSYLPDSAVQSFLLDTGSDIR